MKICVPLSNQVRYCRQSVVLGKKAWCTVSVPGYLKRVQRDWGGALCRPLNYFQDMSSGFSLCAQEHYHALCPFH